MKKRKRKSIRRSICITPEANEFLNARAAELGLSGAEYSRRLMFLEGWAGIVFDDIRAIEAASDAVIGQSGEAYIPYLVNEVQRLRHGIAEVHDMKALVRESILPKLDEAETKIAEVLERHEAALRQWQGLTDMVKTFHKHQGREEA